MTKIIGIIVCAISLILGYLGTMAWVNIQAERAIFAGTFLENIITTTKIDKFKDDIISLSANMQNEANISSVAKELDGYKKPQAKPVETAPIAPIAVEPQAPTPQAPTPQAPVVVEPQAPQAPQAPVATKVVEPAPVVKKAELAPVVDSSSDETMEDAIHKLFGAKKPKSSPAKQEAAAQRESSLLNNLDRLTSQ